MYTSHSSTYASDFLYRLRHLTNGKIENIHTDNPHNERFNRTLQEEFIQLGNHIIDPEIFNRKLTEWLIEYNYFRPHESLGYVTPMYFIQKQKTLLPTYSSCTSSCVHIILHYNERVPHLGEIMSHSYAVFGFKHVLGFSLILLVVAFIVIFALRNSANSSAPLALEDFARCLTEQEARMYGTDWCPYCQAQKKLFGEAFSYINYINCDFHESECSGLPGYPTWYIGQQRLTPGVLSLDSLAQQSGCILSPAAS